jgi:hypothetical protein
MAKGTTIFPDKKKYIYLYCHTVEEKKRYERLAKEAGVKSLSKFLLNAIENGLNPAQPVSNDMAAVEEELDKARDELRITRILLERYQKELQKAKEAVPTLQLDRNLLDLFQKVKKPLSEDDIIKRLPKRPAVFYSRGAFSRMPKLDSDQITNKWPQLMEITDIALQIESMERLGLIKKVGNKGWVWYA